LETTDYRKVKSGAALYDSVVRVALRL